jgi:hypothetical protein
MVHNLPTKLYLGHSNFPISLILIEALSRLSPVSEAACLHLQEVVGLEPCKDRRCRLSTDVGGECWMGMVKNGTYPAW